MQDMKTKFSKAVATFLVVSHATMTRPTFAQFLADRPRPEPVIPAGRIRCNRCDGYGVEITGFAHEMPIEERCPACAGFGHREQRAIDADKAAFEATLPDYDAMAHAAVVAGHEPY
jgi:hypothetical protein